MIRPKHFGYNAETALNNVFQHRDSALSPEQIAARAVEEFDALVATLRENGIWVDVIEDTDTPVKPDAIFPNNWFSTHADGTLVTYPMLSKVRRTERRQDIIDTLSARYRVAKHYSFEVYEEQEMFLEGTGSLVLDRVQHIAYVCISPRSEISLIEKFCILFGYQPCMFHAVYEGQAVYHTNVVMALCTTYVVICLECIPERNEIERLKKFFTESEKEIIEISADQMAAFAGNMIQLQSQRGEQLCVMSARAYKALTKEQIARLEKHNRILYRDVDVIETYGGGSARCMIAENFLPGRERE